MSSKYFESLALTKTKLTIVDVLIDDIADVHRDKKLLLKLINLPWSKKNPDSKYYETCKKIWDDCVAEVKTYPRYKEFSELFDFDIHQVMNAMLYGYMVNTNRTMNNMLESKAYGNHGTMVVLHGTMDLMCSPKFDKNELGKVRQILHKAEELARIGNMLNTYRREIEEDDISSLIMIYALENDFLTFDELKKLSPKEVEARIQPFEKIFIDRAEELLKDIAEKRIKSVDSKKFADERRYIHEKFIERIRYWENES